MPEGQRRESRSLVGRVADSLRAEADDPRRLAQALIREQLGDTGPFLGDGTPECPWVVFDAQGSFYGFYVRDRELVNIVSGRPDRVVCVLRPRSTGAPSCPTA